MSRLVTRILAGLLVGYVVVQIVLITSADGWADVSMSRWVRLVIILIGAAMLWPWHAADDDEFGSFGHWIKDKSHRGDMADMFAVRNALLEEDQRSPPDWSQVVDDVLGGDDWIAEQRLRNADASVVPSLEAALDDPRIRKIIASGEIDDTPAELLIERLGELGSPAARGPMLTLAESRAESDATAIEYVASLGAHEDLPRATRWLAPDDADEYGRRASACVRGLQSAVASGRLDADYRHRIFEAVETRLRQEEDGDEETAILFVTLDAARAAERLFGDGAPKWSSDQLEEIVGAYEELRREPPLYGLQRAPSFPARGLSALVELVEKSDNAYASQKALSILFRQQDPRAQTLHDVLFARGGEDAAAAASACLAAVGLEDWWDRVASLVRADDSHTSSRLCREQLMAFTASNLLGRICNGGMTNVYTNGSGEEFPYRIACFEAIGAHKTAAIIRQADAAFGPAGPPPDEEDREDYYAEHYDELEATLEGLWPDDNEVEICIPIYVLENADKFRKPG